MINWIKGKWQDNIFYKIWIFIMIWSLIFLALWFILDCVGAIAYTWYYNIHFTWFKWFKNLLAIWVVSSSAWVSAVIVLGMFIYYSNHKFKKWNPKNSKLKNETKSQIKEFKKLGNQNLINLNKRIGLVKSKLNQHTLLIGATGSGKTTTALSIINQLVYKLNQTVIIIDGKGDSDLIDKVKVIDNNTFIWNINGDNQYNPFASKSHIVLADKIMSLFDFSEPHYQAVAHSYLLILLETLVNNKIEMTLSNIIKYFSINDLRKIIKKSNPNYLVVSGFDQEQINGLLNRLRVYAEQISTSIGIRNNLTTISKNHKVILFSLNSLDYPQLASNIGKLLIQDLKEFASIKPRNQHINIILDEFNVFASDSIINLINKTRSFNYQCFLCFQTINDLKTDNKDLTDTIFGNTANIIAHNVKDPNSAEYLAKVFGTKTSQKITKQYDTKNKKSSKGSIREVEEYIVHPNDLKKLKVGQAYCKIILENLIHFIDKIIIEKY
ncbi:type IV secretory system conjugative DNA transfer family protein [Spiroplasma ixodetis]|uniref:type IV secretory system conjugative DNA transfer family protein n=1 Tax=Spiroplasma ixodetis TaxID=2141 RepID=UPI00257665D0|nr:type IV secretion system DNA-binding domain-containing protein [Spiroplasma ixodetis]WJG71156.1 hypothetical protein SIXOD_v1c25060 [Spiroplasma ixodetis Y32]